MEHKKLLCQQVQEYIDGLSQRQFQEEVKSGLIYEHIRQCPECSEYFRQAERLSDRLNQWRVPDTKRNITEGIMAQIAQLESDRKKESFNLWSRLPALVVHRIRVPVGVAAAVFVILTVSLFLNITGLNIYPGSEESVVIGPKQTVEGRKFVRVDKQKSYPAPIRPEVVQVQRSSEEGIYFFRVSPEVAPTSLVIILGTPGIVPIESTPQPESHDLINQSL